MSITTTTHLNFPGTAASALEFYQSVFGGSVTRATYGDFGMPQEAPGADKLVFGRLDTTDGLRLMAYDIPAQNPAGVSGTAGTTRRDWKKVRSVKVMPFSLRSRAMFLPMVLSM